MTRTRTALIVDDDAPLRAVFGRALERAGFSVHIADGAAAAAAVLGKHPVSIVVLDNHMPGISGIDAIKLIREERPSSELPILLVSGSSHVRDIELAMSYGANAFLRKPIGLDELVAAVQDLLGSDPSSDVVWPNPLAHGGRDAA